METYKQFNIPLSASQSTSNPASQPTRDPASQPTSHPVNQPTIRPVSQPTSDTVSYLTSHPVSHPIIHPESKWTTDPASQPARQPTSDPASLPASHPASHPANQPTSQPASHPTSHSESHLTSGPSGQPVSHPVNQHSRQHESQAKQPFKSSAQVRDQTKTPRKGETVTHLLRNTMKICISKARKNNPCNRVRMKPYEKPKSLWARSAKEILPDYVDDTVGVDPSRDAPLQNMNILSQLPEATKTPKQISSSSPESSASMQLQQELDGDDTPPVLQQIDPIPVEHDVDDTENPPVLQMEVDLSKRSSPLQQLPYISDDSESLSDHMWMRKSINKTIVTAINPPSVLSAESVGASFSNGLSSPQSSSGTSGYESISTGNQEGNISSASGKPTNPMGDAAHQFSAIMRIRQYDTNTLMSELKRRENNHYHFCDCGMAFRDQEIYDAHYKIHTHCSDPTKEWVEWCTRCGVRLTGKIALQIHLWTCHRKNKKC